MSTDKSFCIGAKWYHVREVVLDDAELFDEITAAVYDDKKQAALHAEYLLGLYKACVIDSHDPEEIIKAAKQFCGLLEDVIEDKTISEEDIEEDMFGDISLKTEPEDYPGFRPSCRSAGRELSFHEMLTYRGV